FPGAMMAVSANGTSNAILWCAERPAGGPGVLHAYDAADLTKQLHSGALTDALAKFTIPTVANGKVYVGALSRLAVFGLVPWPDCPSGGNAPPPGARPTCQPNHSTATAMAERTTAM